MASAGNRRRDGHRRGPPSRYFGLEVVELGAARRPAPGPGRSRPAGRRARPRARAHSISMPGTAASTSTFGSCSRATSIASSSPAGSGTRIVPMLDPPRAGLTNTGQPSSAISSSTRLRSAMAVAAAARRVPAAASPGPGPPRTARWAARARRRSASCTPCPCRPRWRAPRRPRSGPRPSPAGPGSCRPRRTAPCSSGSTTSTSPRLRGGSPGAVTTRPRRARVEAGGDLGCRARPWPPRTAARRPRWPAAGVVRGQDPAAVPGDADRHDLVAVAVDAPRARSRRPGRRSRAPSSARRRRPRPGSCVRCSVCRSPLAGVTGGAVRRRSAPAWPTARPAA